MDKVDKYFPVNPFCNNVLYSFLGVVATKRYITQRKNFPANNLFKYANSNINQSVCCCAWYLLYSVVYMSDRYVSFGTLN